jgi:hypothetical protein
MSFNYDALTLGECEIYINDMHLGFAGGLTLRKTVERLPVDVNTGGELLTRHMVPLRRTLHVEVRLKELSPAAFALFAANGGNEALAAANSGMTDYVRLFAGRPTMLRYIPATTPVVKSADGSVTYAEGGNYVADWENRSFSLAPNSSISPGQLLKVTYTADIPAGREVALANGGLITAKLEALHRYPDCASFAVLHLRRVELDASGVLALGGEDIAEVPVSGRCLADTAHADSPFGYLRFHGGMMPQMEGRL